MPAVQKGWDLGKTLVQRGADYAKKAWNSLPSFRDVAQKAGEAVKKAYNWVEDGLKKLGKKSAPNIKFPVDKRGRLTDGKYVVNPDSMAKHKTGSFNDKGPGLPAGKSQWSRNVDAEKATLDAARAADANNLWVRQPDGTWKAKVQSDRVVGALGRDGSQTNVINVTRKWSEREGRWLIHGNPGTPR